MSEYAETDELAFKASAGELVKDEEAETGRVSWRAYLLALRARGLALTLLLIALVIAAESGYLATAAWLSVWSAQASKNVTNGTGSADGVRSTEYYVSIYAALTMAMAIMNFCEHMTSLVSLIFDIHVNVFMDYVFVDQFLSICSSVFNDPDVKDTASKIAAQRSPSANVLH